MEAAERNYSIRPRDRGESESSSIARNNHIANYMTVEGRESELKLQNQNQMDLRRYSESRTGIADIS